MADVENPYVDVDGDGDGGAAVAEAEPTECSRCTFMFVLGCLVVFQYTVEFRDSHRASRTRLDAAAAVAGLVALFAAGWVLFICGMLVIEWYRGNPEEQGLLIA